VGVKKSIGPRGLSDGKQGKASDGEIKG